MPDEMKHHKKGQSDAAVIAACTRPKGPSLVEVFQAPSTALPQDT